MTKKTTILLNVLAVLLLVGAVSTAGYFYMKYRTLSRTNTKNASTKDVNETVAKVAKLMQLPADENPTFAEVTDVTKLQSQPFFKNAANGDRVLIYPKALKAILYRPSINKIIDVGPIKLENKGKVAGASDTNSGTSPEEKTGPVSAALYNGSALGGATASVEAELKTKFPNVNVLSRAPARSSNYSYTLVVDVKGGHTSLVKEMAQQLNAKVASLPVGEATPSADLLIIVGNTK